VLPVDSGISNDQILLMKLLIICLFTAYIAYSERTIALTR